MTAAETAQRPRLLLDTHVLVWLILGEAGLGAKTRAAIRVAARQDRLLVAAITPWEIAMLVTKKRIELDGDVMDWVRDALATPGLSLVPLEPEIAVASTRLPFAMHADPADRMLVATSRHLGATLVTADEALLGIAGKGHFRVMDAGK